MSPADPADLPDLPRRPALRRGLRVLRRERDVLQVGLDPSKALWLPTSDGVRRTLRVLAEAGLRADCDPAVLAGLEARDLLEPPAPTGRPARVAVRTFGCTPLPAVAPTLREAGLVAAPGGSVADVALLVGVGEPDRGCLDDWVVDGVPHLVVRFSEGDAVLGPYVVPGETACLRCVDAHHTDVDARWPLLVAQQAAQGEVSRRDGLDEAPDPLLLRLALAWAARDLVAAVGTGAPPSTRSTTLRLPAYLAGFEATCWLRHPDCGCSAAGPPVATAEPA